MTNPVDDPDLYDGMELGSLKSPGKVTFSGHDRVVKWDVKAGSGQKGATTTLKEIPPIEFTATFYIADMADMDAMEDFLDLVDSTVSGKTPKALDCYHPDLADNNITSVVKASTGGAVHDGKGGVTYVVKFQEYAPPKPAGGSPSGSKKKEVDPNAAALAELAALTDQYKRTNWDGTVITGPLPP